MAYLQLVIDQYDFQTFILFSEQPDIEDMLLNCVALAFLPSVDQAMVVIIQSLRPGMYPLMRNMHRFKHRLFDNLRL